MRTHNLAQALIGILAVWFAIQGVIAGVAVVAQIANAEDGTFSTSVVLGLLIPVFTLLAVSCVLAVSSRTLAGVMVGSREAEVDLPPVPDLLVVGVSVLGLYQLVVGLNQFAAAEWIRQTTNSAFDATLRPVRHRSIDEWLPIVLGAALLFGRWELANLLGKPRSGAEQG